MQWRGSCGLKRKLFFFTGRQWLCTTYYLFLSMFSCDFLFYFETHLYQIICPLPQCSSQQSGCGSLIVFACSCYLQCRNSLQFSLIYLLFWYSLPCDFFLSECANQTGLAYGLNFNSELCRPMQPSYSWNDVWNLFMECFIFTKDLR